MWVPHQIIFLFFTTNFYLHTNLHILQTSLHNCIHFCIIYDLIILFKMSWVYWYLTPLLMGLFSTYIGAKTYLNTFLFYFTTNFYLYTNLHNFFTLVHNFIRLVWYGLMGQDPMRHIAPDIRVCISIISDLTVLSRWRGLLIINTSINRTMLK